MSNITILNDKNFNKEIIDSKVTALVDFWATWCGPCQQMAPVIEDIAKEFSDRIKVYKLNVDDNMQTASNFNIMSIPTIVFFKDGKEQDRLIGALPKQEIVKKIKELTGA